MVNAMIDELMWEVKNENVKSEFKNTFQYNFSKRSIKRRKRIRKEYNEIERGDNINESMDSFAI